MFQDVRFYPILNFGQFLADLHFFSCYEEDAQNLEFLPHPKLAIFGPPSQRCPAAPSPHSVHCPLVSSYRNKTTRKDTGGNNMIRVFLVKTSPAEGRRRLHKNTACAGLVVQVFRWFRCVHVFMCFGVLVFVQVFTCHDISEDQKGDQGGGPKMAQIEHGVKPDICKITENLDDHFPKHKQFSHPRS